MKYKTEALQPETTYHVYNRANGDEKLFCSQDNYNYFLQKYIQYISPVADTFCYCLMPNHFHFIIRIKSEDAITNLQGFQNLEGLKRENIEGFLSKQFSNFFNSYTKALNKQQNRKGNLFMHTFKRKKVDNTFYLRKLVHYIHFNPIEAGMCKAPDKYFNSSYRSLISNAKTLLKREETISWFDDLDNFKFIHNHPPQITGIDLSFL